MTLIDQLPAQAGPDSVFDAFAAWAEEQGFTLYPPQEEALIEIVSGANVIVSTPTGSGKSLVATGAHFAALAQGVRSFYTAPIKALVSEKFFALCDIFGADKRRHDDRRRERQRHGADHLLHRRGPGQHRAARRRGGRHRPGRDGRVPLLRRPGPRLGLAGAAARAAAGAVPADVGDARRRQPVRAGPDPAHRPADRRGQLRRAPGAAGLLLRAHPAARDARGAAGDPAGAGLRRALHPGGRGRAGAGADEHQRVHPRGEGRDRRR